MFCHTCGSKTGEGSKFCEECGTPIISNNSTPHKEVEVILNSPPHLDSVKTDSGVSIKCGNCDYVGPPEKARSIAAVVLAWLCVFFAPLITIIYFLATNKYRCPKCKSTFVRLKKQDGTFVEQKTSKRPLVIFIWVLLAIAVIGILSSVVLASLNTAREKGQAAQEAAQQHNPADGLLTH